MTRDQINCMVNADKVIARSRGIDKVMHAHRDGRVVVLCARSLGIF